MGKLNTYRSPFFLPTTKASSKKSKDRSNNSNNMNSNYYIDTHKKIHQVTITVQI